MITPYPQILCLGDSITEGAWAPGGYVQRLAEEFRGRYDVINRGYSGYTSRQLLAKLKDDFFLPEAGSQGPGAGSALKLVILNIGTNDSVIEGRGLQHVPLDEYRKNVSAIVDILRARVPTVKFVLVTPTIVDPDQWTRYLVGTLRNPPEILSQPLDRSEEVTKQYRDACIEFAKSANISVVDAWEALESKVNAKEVEKTELLHDGLHLSGQAYGILFGKIRSVLRNQFNMESAATLPPSFVPWDQYLNGNKLPEDK